jgi:uncharacterized protein (DUF4415 family)
MPRKKFDAENPEWTKSDFAKAKKFPPGTKLADAVKALPRRGRPPLVSPKAAVKLRIDADVIESYRSTGEGWQSRINADLRKARRLGKSADR